MKNYTLFIAAFLFLSSCTYNDSSLSKVPECVKIRIKQFQNEPVRNPAAKIFSYEFKGKTVYYIPPFCCDAYSELIDSDCKFICAPDGGLNNGSGNGNCKDFLTVRKDEKLIWADPR